MNINYRQLFIAVLFVILSATPIWAGGAIFYEVASPDMGSAAAGRAALAQDASTAYGNPTVMARLDFSGFQEMSLDSEFDIGEDIEYTLFGVNAASGGDGGDASDTTPSGSQEYTDEEIAEMINNPLGHLWLTFLQNDTIWIDGDIFRRLREDEKVLNITMFQPVLPIQLTEDLKLILRPVIPMVSTETVESIEIDRSPGSSTSGVPALDTDERDFVDVNWKRETGLGDIVLWNALATNDMAKPPWIFGFGPTFMMDTASDPHLGTGRWSAGPLGLALYVGENWIIGGVAQHWWSFDRDEIRDEVSLTDFQYIIRWRVTKETNIGCAPNIRYNWQLEDEEKGLIVPVGIGADTLFNLGPIPTKVGLETYYYAVTPDSLGPQWQVRFFMAFVLPAPKWAKTPIF